MAEVEICCFIHEKIKKGKYGMPNGSPLKLVVLLENVEL